MVSVTGFEPAISPPQTDCPTKLGHTEIFICKSILYWLGRKGSNLHLPYGAVGPKPTEFSNSSTTQYINNLAPRERLELPTTWVETKHSIQLK